MNAFWRDSNACSHLYGAFSIYFNYLIFFYSLKANIIHASANPEMKVDTGVNSVAVDEESHFFVVHDEITVENCKENNAS